MNPQDTEGFVPFGQPIVWKVRAGGVPVEEHLRRVLARRPLQVNRLRAPIIRPGDRFGRWKVLDVWSPYLCACVCICGAYAIVESIQLRKGGSQSCGCMVHEKHRLRGDIGTRTPEYRIWQQMKDRCSNPRNPAYPHYGGRGITVCERWRESFHAFIANVGRRPSSQYSIDRWPNNDGNYEPGNCRWATRKQQCLNTRRNKRFELNGVRRTLAEWADLHGIGRSALRGRLGRGYALKQALAIPIKQYNRRTA